MDGSKAAVLAKAIVVVVVRYPSDKSDGNKNPLLSSESINIQFFIIYYFSMKSAIVGFWFCVYCKTLVKDQFDEKSRQVIICFHSAEWIVV